MALLLFILLKDAAWAKQFTAADTTLCRSYEDSVNLYSQRFDAVDSMLFYADIMLECCKETKNSKGIVTALSVIGVGHFRKSDYTVAMKYYREAEAIALENNDSSSVAKLRINIGNSYAKQDSLKQALTTFLAAATIFEQLGDSVHLAYLYNSMAGTMGMVGNVEERLRYSILAHRFYGERLSDIMGLGIGANLTHHLEQANLLDSAERFGLRVLAASQKAGVEKTEAQVLNYLAGISLRNEKYEEAVQRCQQALTKEGKISAHWLFNDLYSYMGEAFMKLGRNKEALTALETGLKYAKADKGSRSYILSYSRLHELYAKEGRFDKAYEYLHLYSNLRDSVYKVENAANVNELQTKYETEKKEQAIRELDQANQLSQLRVRQRTTLAILVAVLMLVAIAVVYFRSRQRVLQQERIALDNRLRSLRVQMNPHFIFNALSAIQNYLISGKDIRESTRYLSNFAKVMRAFLEFNQKELVSLEKEMQALELYLGIQKLRFDNGFTHAFNLDEEIEPEMIEIPPMLLQPFVENAIEHGIRNVTDGHIDINYHLKGNELVMEVVDNGVGRGHTASEKPKVDGKTSLATGITAERIALLNRNSRKGHRFEITDANPDGSGTKVVFHIPLKNG
jgi:tetratricopeptide (TPR) repeat protein